MLAVVLAAGRGTRLGPLTIDRSKAMMPVTGRPMIDEVLSMLAKGGVDDVIVVAHPDDRELRRHLGRSRQAVRVVVAYQHQRLGMAHALGCAAPLVRELKAHQFLLASCDNLYPQGHVADLVACRAEGGLDAALTLMWTPPEEATTSAVVVLQNGLVADILEKPGPDVIPSHDLHEALLCAPSLYALSSRILDYVPLVAPSARGEREFPDALRLVIADGGTVGGRTVRSRMTLTEPRDLLALNCHALHSDPSRATVEETLPAGATVIPPVRIETGASVASGCQIGPYTFLEGGCRVGRGAVVRRSIVLRGGSVMAGDVVEDSVIVGLAPAR